jgi:hypothetical protein
MPRENAVNVAYLLLNVMIIGLCHSSDDDYKHIVL